MVFNIAISHASSVGVIASTGAIFVPQDTANYHVVSAHRPCQWATSNSLFSHHPMPEIDIKDGLQAA